MIRGLPSTSLAFIVASLLSVVCFFLPVDVLAQEKLGIAIPYQVSEIGVSKFQEPINRIVLSNISYGLLLGEGQGGIRLGLAKQFKTSDSFSDYEFTLAGDRLFGDQTAIQAQDVRKSYSRMISRILKRSHASNEGVGDELQSEARNVASVEVVQDLGRRSLKSGQGIVRFRLKEPSSSFPRLLATLPIANPEIVDAFGTSFGKGTDIAFAGPYQVRTNRPDSGVLLERTPNFFRVGYPRVELLEFRVIGSADEALAALRVGAIDVIAMPTGKLIEETSEDPTLIVLDSPLRNMASGENYWRLPQSYWSKPDEQSDRLSVSKVVMRKSLRVDEHFRDRFDLSGTFLP